MKFFKNIFSVFLLLTVTYSFANANVKSGLSVSDFVVNSGLGEALEAVIQVDYNGAESLRGVVRSAHPYVDFIDYTINKNSDGAAVVFTSRVPINEPFTMRLQFDNGHTTIKQDVLVQPFDNRPEGLIISKSPDFTNGVIATEIEGLANPSSESDIERIERLQNELIEKQNLLNDMVKTYEARQR